MVNVAFLGTGGAFSAGRRSNVALLIKVDHFRMLVEAGPTVMQQLARLNPEPAEVENLFISHSHGDHALGFPMLALNRIETQAPLHVYAGPSTIHTLEGLWALAYPGLDIDRINLHWHPLSEQDPQVTVLADGIVLRTVPVPHPPPVPTLAARWDLAGGLSIAFATDTVPNVATVGLAYGCDLLIHEASYSAVLQPEDDAGKYFHSTAQQAGEIARLAGCARLALVHLGPETGEHPDVLAEEARAGTDLQVIVPEDGERICL